MNVKQSACWVLGALSVLAGCRHFPGSDAGPVPVNLLCDQAVNPLGVDSLAPRLQWQVPEGFAEANIRLAEVIVSTDLKELKPGSADLWKPGLLASPFAVNYAGKELPSSVPVYWKVRVWDEAGKASRWSNPARFTTGLRTNDWEGSWIRSTGTNATELLRKEFKVKPGLLRAVIHVCGLGQYELHANGRRVGNQVLTPGWTKYDKTCLYDTHDITQLLKPGKNALGLLLANGMYNVTGGRYVKFKGSFGPLQAIAQLHLQYRDGTQEIVATDDSWQSHAGPITFSCIFGGEDYDARLEVPNWSEPGIDLTGWEKVLVANGPGGVLRGHSGAAAPLAQFEVLRPKSIVPLKPGTEVYDLGQNAPLMLRLRVRGRIGDVVRVIPSELLNADGSVDRRSVGGGNAWWQYTLGRNGEQSWESKFWYHGARYLQVEGRCGETNGALPEVVLLEGLVTHSSSRPVGKFECSNQLFNRTHTLIRWAQRANLVSLISDCPHRERLGWLEQYHLNGPSLRYEWDLSRIFNKGMLDMADSQTAEGLVPDIAPEYVVFNDGFRDSPEWGIASIIVPWQEYLWTGNPTLLRRYYSTMARYLDYLGSRATGHILDHGLGDWYDLGPNPPGQAQLTPRALTATAFYYEGARVMSEAARLAGKKSDAARYDALATEIRHAFNARFFNATNSSYATGSQTGNAIPLVLGIAPAEHRDKVVQSIVEDIRSRGNGLTAGDVGYRYLLRSLADAGRSDVIFDMNQQTDKPGYGYQLKQGATSLTEAWDAGRASSQNHFMLGHIMEWFYHDLAGIAPDPAGPGFEKIRFRPQPVGDVTWARAEYQSVRGRIASEWKRENDRFELQIAVPAGSTATVQLPGKTECKAPESAAQQVPGSYIIGSGTHRFTCRL